MVTINELFDVKTVEMKDFFQKYTYPVEILPLIHDYILELGKRLDKKKYHEIKENVWVSNTAFIGDGVEIIGPAIIMENVKLNHACYIRENVIIGNNSSVGNSCEIKNSILLENVAVAHFNYVGDSLLGNHVHLGAGAIISNLRLDKCNVRVEHEDTSLRKIGAFIGDNTEIGCNSVICPGTVIMKKSVIFPLQMVKGKVDKVYKENKIELKRI